MPCDPLTEILPDEGKEITAFLVGERGKRGGSKIVSLTHISYSLILTLRASVKATVPSLCALLGF